MGSGVVVDSREWRDITKQRIQRNLFFTHLLITQQLEQVYMNFPSKIISPHRLFLNVAFYTVYMAHQPLLNLSR